MAGNVSEWVFDAFTLPYYGPCGACENPRVDVQAGAIGDEWRVLRGSSFDSQVFARTTARGRWKRREVAGNLGFRCAADSVQQP
jgi:formylglycine-generating enzyme required for sulfatase activity